MCNPIFRQRVNAYVSGELYTQSEQKLEEHYSTILCVAYINLYILAVTYAPLYFPKYWFAPSEKLKKTTLTVSDRDIHVHVLWEIVPVIQLHVGRLTLLANYTFTHTVMHYNKHFAFCAQT